MSDLKVVLCTEDQLPSLESVIAVQNERRKDLDPRLPRGFPDGLSTRLRTALHDSNYYLYQAFQDRRLLGMAAPEVVAHGSDSEMLTYWPKRNGVMRYLSLACASSNELERVLRELLKVMSRHWDNCNASGATVIWPTRDYDISVPLEAAGFATDAHFAFRRIPPPIVLAARSEILVRDAVPADTDALVNLYTEVILAHIPHSPFAMLTPAAERAFRRRLENSWSGLASDQGASIVSVAQLHGEIVAMAECWLAHTDSDLKEMLPEGRYGYVNSFGVAKSVRGRGIGAVLERAVSTKFASLGLDGSCLWYSVYNASASQFWPRMGYESLWTSYQRRNHP